MDKWDIWLEQRQKEYKEHCRISSCYRGPQELKGKVSFDQTAATVADHRQAMQQESRLRFIAVFGPRIDNVRWLVALYRATPFWRILRRARLYLEIETEIRK